MLRNRRTASETAMEVEHVAEYILLASKIIHCILTNSQRYVPHWISIHLEAWYVIEGPAAKDKPCTHIYYSTHKLLSNASCNEISPRKTGLDKVRQSEYQPPGNGEHELCTVHAPLGIFCQIASSFSQRTTLSMFCVTAKRSSLNVLPPVFLLISPLLAVSCNERQLWT